MQKRWISYNQEQIYPGFLHQNNYLKLHLEISQSTERSNNAISIKLLLNEQIHNGFQHLIFLFFFLKYSILSRWKFATHSLQGLRKGDFATTLRCSSLMSIVLHMFTRTEPGNYSVVALCARSDLSAKWEMRAVNTLSLWQVMVMSFMTWNTPLYFSVLFSRSIQTTAKQWDSWVTLPLSEPLD